MNKNINWLSISIGSIIIVSLMIDDAYAYLDPATASLVFQMLIGVFVGGLITIRIFWQKIKLSISSRFARNET